MSETRILIRLLLMYFPQNWEFGSALSKLQNFGGGGLTHTPSPKVRHCFGSLKTRNTCWCEANADMKQPVMATDTDISLFCVRMQALVACGTCLKVDDNYVHVWCVPSATHTPCIQWSYNKVLNISVFVTLFLKQLCPYKIKQYHFRSGYWRILFRPTYTPLKITSRKFGQDK
jgi:hypothetical protein